MGINLPRFDEPGFYAEHRLPETQLGVGRIKKPKKAKKNKASAGGNIHLGDAFSANSKPQVVAIRPAPRLAVPSRHKPKPSNAKPR